MLGIINPNVDIMIERVSTCSETETEEEDDDNKTNSNNRFFLKYTLLTIFN